MKRRQNHNRIVRISNPVIWELVRHAAWQTGVSHQSAFNALMRMMQEGYVIGSHTHWELFVRITEEMKGRDVQ